MAGKLGHAETVQAFIDMSAADSGSLDEELKMAIAVANAYKHEKVVEVLMAAGFDPNAPDLQLVTPLHSGGRWGSRQGERVD